MAYTPTPGTLPAKLHDYLHANQGKEFTSATLGAEFGIETSTVNNALSTPVKHGAVKRDKRMNIIYWTAGDGTPPGMPHDYEPDEPLRRTAAPGLPSPMPATSVFDMVRGTPPAAAKEPEAAHKPAPKPKPAPAPAAPTPAATEDATFRLYCNGGLGITKDGANLELSPDERRRLVKFVSTFVE